MEGLFGLPGWVGDTISLVSLAIGAPALILWLLGRKDANRKLNVEEGGLTVDQFNAALPAYQGLLTDVRAELATSKAETATVVAQLEEAEGVIEDVRDEVYVLHNSVIKLRELISRLISKHHFVLTPEELDELEQTKPGPLKRPGRKK